MMVPMDGLRAALAGRYRIERELGAGGMATVYQAEDLKHDRKVALKVLREDLTASLGADRFHREITIAAGLTHPHIVALYDSGEAAGRLFYVMPYVEGQSLRQKLLREGALSIADAVRILRDVADAMAYAHKRGVVHRDLKPENVMLSERHALVTDFGVAKALSEATGRQTLTTAGVALGTPTYMSPEQATADPRVDHRSDIYAFGVVAYELLTGQPPFGGDAPQAVLAAHVTAAAVPVGEQRASIPGALASLVMKCLEKRPADRWQSAEDLIGPLEALLTPSGGITPQETAPIAGTLWGTARRHRGLAITTGAAVLLLAAVLWRTRLSLPVTSIERADPRPSVLVVPHSGALVVADSGFAEGFQEELRASLTRIGGLRLLARWTGEFNGPLSAVQEIGREYEADYLLETAISTAPGSVRVAAALVNTESGDEVWRDTFVRPLTGAGLFGIQADIARAVAGELRVEISMQEERRLAQGGTSDLQAYEYYLRAFAAGNDYEEPGRRVMEEAQTLLEVATTRDDRFALAFARLASVHGWFVLRRWDTSPERRERARTAAERAMRLAPDLPESHLAMATYHYRVERDYPKALDALVRAEGWLRGDGYAALLRAYIERRMGRWTNALASLEEARKANPRSDVPLLQTVVTLRAMRQWADAKLIVEQAIALRPERLSYRRYLAMLEFEMTGKTEALRRFYESVADPDLYVDGRWLVEYLDGAWTEAIAVLERATIRVISNQTTIMPLSLLHGWTLMALGDSAGARAKFTEAIALVDSLRMETEDDHRIHRALGLANAGLGHAVEALAQAQEALALIPPSKDALDGPLNVEALAKVHAQLGNVHAAIDVLRQYFSAPGRDASPSEMRLDPRYASLRNHPAFVQLVASPATDS